MKKLTVSFAVLAFLAAFTFSSCKEEAPVVEEVVEAVALTGDFSANLEASSLSWLGKKVTGEHFGSIKLKDASFSFADGVLTGGKAVVDMTTISVEDVTDAEKNADLVGHLSTEDFFNAAKYPEATLVITGSENGNAFGELSIKDSTHVVEFPYILTESETDVTLEGTVVVDRTLYDIKYGSGKFFQNLGDKAINDEFELKFKVVATK
jgi:polyisoprenoid-binding protein YceI